jgi:hypothetical protein
MSALPETEQDLSIKFSLGVNRFDARPKQRQAADFQEFKDVVLTTRSAVKGFAYISAAFTDGHRSKDSVGLCRFIPFDFDGIPQESFSDLRMHLAQYAGFGYTTASHTPEAPRARAILEASREMTREERVRVCMAVQANIERYISGIKFDTSVYRGEQPVFTPMIESTDFEFQGEPVDVDAMLEHAPEIKDGASKSKNIAQISSTDPVLRELSARGMVKRDLGGGRFGVHCPCADEHSGPSESETATVYTLPKFNGFDFGNFTCLHDHCRERPQHLFMDALGLEHAQVRGEQSKVPDVDHSALIQKQQEKIQVKAEERRGRFRFLRAADLMREQRVGWRVLDVIPKRGLVVMWGAPGSGKSFAAFDIGAAIARGDKYQGKRVKKGLVLIIAAEGDLTARTMAYIQEHNIRGTELDNLLIMQRAVNMLDPHQDMDDLLATIEMVVDSVGEELALVIVDTLNRVMPGGNENASEDMGAVIANAKKIEEAFKCAVMFIHHSGKDETKGSRGHSSLKGAMDAEISIVRQEEIRTFRIEKQKEGRDYYDLYNFKLKTIDLGPMANFDSDAEDHERLTSCVIEPTDEVPQKISIPKNSGVFQAAILASATGDKEDVRVEFYKRHKGDNNAKRQAFNRAWAGYMSELVVKKDDLGRDIDA